MQGFTISTNQNKFDFDVIYQFLTNSYWARGIPKETVQKSIDNALCFAVLTDQGQQVGFARVITDKATFAYLADVFIVEEFRRQGLSKWLIKTIMSHPELQGLRRIMLATQDAHGLYSQFGFEAPKDIEMLMQIRHTNLYEQNK